MSVIRLASENDAAQLVEIYAPSVAASATSFEEVVPTAAEMAARVAKTLVRTPYLVCEQGGQVDGFAYGSQHRERPAYRFSVDVTVYVRESARRRGVARAIYTSLLNLLEYQNYYAAHAGITLPNVASVALHEALGFRSVGVYPGVGCKLNAWRDVGWWQRELRERAGVPAEPRPLPEVPRDDEWNERLNSGLSWLRP